MSSRPCTPTACAPSWRSVPARSLTGLAGQILGDREHAAVCLDRRGRAGLAVLLDGFGRLAVRGVAMDVAALGAACAGTAREDGAAEPDRPRMTVKIDGGNYGRPYPPLAGAAPDVAVPQQTPQQGTLPDGATQEEQPPQQEVTPRQAPLNGFAPNDPPQEGIPAAGAAPNGAAPGRAPQEAAAPNGAAPEGTPLPPGQSR